MFVPLLWSTLADEILEIEGAPRSRIARLGDTGWGERSTRRSSSAGLRSRREPLGAIPA